MSLVIPRLSVETFDIEVAPGVYDISNEEYHASIGISNSGLSEFMCSPRKYWYRYLYKQYESKETPVLKFGKALHSYVLENSNFWNEYLLEEKIDRRTKIGKEKWKDFLKRKGNKELISKEDLEIIEQMTDSIMNHPEAVKLITNGVFEKSLYWYDKDTSVLCKARPDLLFPGALADLKTTESVHEKDYYYSIKRYGYDRQAAIGLDGIEAITGKKIEAFFHIAVEKEPPYEIEVYQIDQCFIESGREKYKSTLSEYKQCLQANQWPSRGRNQIRKISLNR